MFLTKLMDTGNGIGRRLLLVALSALLVIATLVIIPGNAYGDEDSSVTTTSEPAATDTTVSDTTVPDTTIPETSTTTVAAELAPDTEDTTTTSTVVEVPASTTSVPPAEEDTTTASTVVEVPASTTSVPPAEEDTTTASTVVEELTLAPLASEEESEPTLSLLAAGRGISIEKYTNGVDADSPTGPILIIGDPVTWTYVVTNLAHPAIRLITVTDSDPGITVSCPSRKLHSIGNSMTCTASGIAQPGQYSNTATVTGKQSGHTVTDSDDSHYLGVEPASLILAKTVITDNGGDAVAGDWTLFINLGISDEFGVPGSTGGAEVTDQAGTYTLSELPSNPGGTDGYTQTSLTCDNDPGVEVTSVTIDVGETITCTFVNDDLTPGLALEKRVVNDHGGNNVAPDWTLTATSTSGDGDFSLPADQGLTPDRLEGSTGLWDVYANNTYTLSETGPDGYTQVGQWECVFVDPDNQHPFGDPIPGNTITLSEGEAAICGVTNNDIAPTLKLSKIVLNEDGGTAHANEWRLGAAGDGGIPPTHGIEVVPGQAIVGPQDVKANVEYTLSETGGPAGYTPSDWLCTIFPAVGAAASTVTGDKITLGEGESASCQIYNSDDAPTLQLVKTVDNAAGGDNVADDWTLTAVSQGSDASGDISTLGGSGTPDDVFAAVVYALAETTVPGYTNGTTWSCTSGTMNAAKTGVTLTIGQDAVCTIINDDIAPTLNLFKSVVNDHGGNAVPADWTLKATSDSNDGDFALPASDVIQPLMGATGAQNVYANNTYTLSETGPDGYTQVGQWTCVTTDAAGVKGPIVPGDTITLAEGESADCLVVNTDDTAELTLVKHVVNDNGGTSIAADWTLKATSTRTFGDFSALADQNTDDGGLTGDTGVHEVDANNEYTLSETGTADYTQVGMWSCVIDGADAVLSNTITLDHGEKAICTATNDDDATALILAKTVINDNGGSAVAANWSLYINLGISGEQGVTGSTAGAEVTNKAGFYTLSELGPGALPLPGYTNTSVYCDNNPGSNVRAVTIHVGETITCTFVNDDDAPTLTLIKHVVNDDGGDATADQWTLSAGANDVTGSEAGVLATDQIGTYALSETALAGYTNTSITCDNDLGVEVTSVTVGLGDDIECTFVNDDVAPTLDLFKAVLNDHGGNALPPDWTLEATSTSGNGDFALPAGFFITFDVGATTPQDVFANNEYTLSETGESDHTDDYTQDGPWSCWVTDAAGVEGDKVLGDTITLDVGESAECVVVNDDDVAELTLVKHVVNDNGGTSVAADWTLKATSDSGNGDISALADQNTSADDLTGDTGVHEVHANNEYTLSETGTTDYTQTPDQWSCVIDGADPVLSNTITLAHGASAVCTAVNDDDAPSLILVKDVVNDNGGNAVASDWDLFIDEGAAGEKSVPGSVSGLKVTDQAGTYDLSESTLAGYTNTLITCDNLPDGVPPGAPVTTATVVVGETVTCTFTNDDIAPTLILAKSVQNRSGGDSVAADWTLTATSTSTDGDFSLLADKNTSPDESEGDTGTQDVYANNTYTLSETGPDGYGRLGQWECTITDATGAEGAPVDGNTITLGEGESAKCWVDNIDVTPTLILAKSVQNRSGGDSVAADWTLKATSDSNHGDFSLLADKNTSTDESEGDTGTQDVYANNTYTLSETGPDGYGSLGQWECTITDATGAEGAPVDGNTITLGEGESAKCWVDNIDVTPTLILAKSVQNRSGGDSVAADWTLKATSDSNHGDFSLLADKNTSTDESEGDTGTQDVYANNTYTLSETGPDGYGRLGQWECTITDATGAEGAPVDGNTITLGEGESAKCWVDNIDVTPTLILAKSVQNRSGGDSVAADWTLKATSDSNHGDFSLLADKNTSTDESEGDTGTQDVYANNTYTLSETGPDGYGRLGQWECTITDATGAEGAPVDGDTITLGEGESAVCWVINDDLAAGVDIEKSTNGHDADTPTGPYVPVGDAIDWEYEVTNPGLIPLSDVVVTDDMGVTPVYQSGDTNTDRLLDPGETWIYTATGVAVAGQYANIGTVTAVVGSGAVLFGVVDAGVGDTITDTDMSHYFGVESSITIEKSTNGEDADTPTGPEILSGETVTWEYVVTNTGNTPLANVVVTDDQGVTPVYVSGDTNTDDLLDTTETWIYQATGVAVLGQYANMGTATGTDVTEEPTSDTDMSHYIGTGLASLGDTVWNDANSNGVQDNGEKGIAGALVKLTLPDGTTLDTTTDVDGKYLFSGLIPGTYTVEIVMSSIPQPDEGELKLTTAGSFTVILAVGDHDLDSDFGVVAVLPVTGINTTDIARIAFALLLAGALAVLLTTRKRRDEGNIAA